MFSNSNFWGMNLIWWILWAAMLAWIFIIPYDIPGQRKKKIHPLISCKKDMHQVSLLLSSIMKENEFLKKIPKVTISRKFF